MGEPFQVQWPPTESVLLLIPALLVAFTVHELAHAIVALLLGDTSQVERNRLSFNPLRHVSWIGLLVFLLLRFGWAKPVYMDPTRFRMRNRAFGVFLVAIAGPAANLLTGLLVLGGMILTVTLAWLWSGAPLMTVWEFLMPAEPGFDLQGAAVALSYYMMGVNFLLALFNALPFPTLDGFHALVSLYAALRMAFQGGLPDLPALRPASAVVGDGDELTRSPAWIHFDIGLEYHHAGQFDEAIARYRQATAHDEGFALAYYNLGLAYWAKGRISSASGAFRAALRPGGDMAVRMEADRRLQQLARAEQVSARPEQGPAHPEQVRGGAELDPIVALGPPPPPLEPGEAAAGAGTAGAPPLDPEVTRRVWLGLAGGAVAMAVLAFAAWLFVTTVILGAMGGM